MLENKEAVEVKKESSNWEEALEQEAWVAPLIDIYETEDNFILSANMPGVTKENVKIKLEDETLILMGRINFQDSLNRKYVLKESEVGNYFRKFNLSNSIDSSNIDAKLENGQLLVTLPKHERIKPRNIDIK